MISNPSIVGFPYKTGNKALIHYLIYDCHLPVLSVCDGVYYFTKTEELEKYLKDIPLLVKIRVFLNK